MIARMPDGQYSFEDRLDDDGITDDPVPIRVKITIKRDQMTVDFTGSSPAVTGSVNAVSAIVHSAIGYVIRCVAGEDLPNNHGVFAPITVIIPPGSVLDQIG